jgi:uracil-DNA glycosylase
MRPVSSSHSRQTLESKSLSPSQELNQLHDTIRSCKNCGLHATRTQAVPGVGPCPADVMIVGEAPGFNEDRQGEPFVGAAGKLLDTLLSRISLSRADVYITNVLKCRPPMNRDPMPNEVDSCSPYLQKQLDLVKPKAVLILGRHALERLMPGQGSISRIHGTLVKRGDVAYVPLYHPAAALHNGALVADLEKDFDRVRQYLDQLLAPPPPPPPVPTPKQEPEQLSLL